MREDTQLARELFQSRFIEVEISEWTYLAVVTRKQVGWLLLCFCFCILFVFALSFFCYSFISFACLVGLAFLAGLSYMTSCRAVSCSMKLRFL